MMKELDTYLHFTALANFNIKRLANIQIKEPQKNIPNVYHITTENLKQVMDSSQKLSDYINSTTMESKQVLDS